MSQSSPQPFPQYLSPAPGSEVKPTPQIRVGPLRAILLGFPLLFSAASSHLQPATVSSVPQTEIVPIAPDLLSLPERQEPPQLTAPAAPAVASASPSSPPSTPPSQRTAPPPSASPSSPAPPTLPAPPKALATVPIRIGLTRATTQVQLHSSTAAVIMDAEGNQISALPAQTSTLVKPGGANLNVDNLSFPSEIWIKPSSEGLVAVNGRWYRGSIQIIADQQRLVTVNHLDLESYLYSVVGAEMSSSWPIEALKAQAIAARSYALARLSGNRASPYYDLGDTPRWQAYRGVETEAHRTHQAVNSTQGLLVSYQGAVVETLYASTEHLVRTVHKGYGMSQNSAKDLAQEQLNYQQILNHFYPGTTLAWLQAS